MIRTVLPTALALLLVAVVVRAAPNGTAVRLVLKGQAESTTTLAPGTDVAVRLATGKTAR